MIEIHRPRMYFDYVDGDQRHGRLIMEPLERGYGTTLAAILKDVMVFQTPGAAPVGLKIDGIVHPDQPIDGLQEKMRTIALRLKSVEVAPNGEGVAEKTVVESTGTFTGPVTVKAGDFSVAGMEILNPHVVLFQVLKGSKVKCTLYFASGTSYMSTEEIKKEYAIDEDDQEMHLVDAMFSPVVRVDYRVGDARIGQDINFDRVVMDISTNGAIDARDAIVWAANFFGERLEILEKPLAQDVPDVVFAKIGKEMTETSVNISINDIELTIRAKNCLKLTSVETLDDLTQKTAEELLQIKNFGRKSLNELRRVMAQYGLALKGEKPDQGLEDSADYEENEE